MLQPSQAAEPTGPAAAYAASLPKYRADIDGLRAIAVLSVVLYHAFPAGLKGGFTGVDVFFVISGYLITSIIFGSLESGKFRLSQFYGRRIRRIFPALILVFSASLLLGALLLWPHELERLAWHVLAGAGFLANLAYTPIPERSAFSLTWQAPAIQM